MSSFSLSKPVQTTGIHQPVLFSFIHLDINELMIDAPIVCPSELLIVICISSAVIEESSFSRVAHLFLCLCVCVCARM